MRRCCECKHWKVNAMTQKSGMGLCPNKKAFMSYQEVCPGFTKVYIGGKNVGKKK